MNKISFASKKARQKTRGQKGLKKNNRLIIVAVSTLLLLVVLSALAVNSLLAAPNSPTMTPTPNPTPTSTPALNHATTKVQLQIQYSGNWTADYGSGTSTEIAIEGETFNGTGSKTLTITRPDSSDPVWAMTLSAKKTDIVLPGMSAIDDPLTISILKLDGTVLDTSSVSALNETIIVSATIID
jgi:hypothetical protein